MWCTMVHESARKENPNCQTLDHAAAPAIMVIPSPSDNSPWGPRPLPKFCMRGLMQTDAQESSTIRTSSSRHCARGSDML